MCNRQSIHLEFRPEIAQKVTRPWRGPPPFVFASTFLFNFPLNPLILIKRKCGQTIQLSARNTLQCVWLANSAVKLPFSKVRVSRENRMGHTYAVSLEENKMAWRSVHFVWRWCKKFFAFSRLNPVRIRWVFSAKSATLARSTRLPRTHPAIREFFIHLLFWRQNLFSIKSAQPRTSPFVGWLVHVRPSTSHIAFAEQPARRMALSRSHSHTKTLGAVVSVTHPPPAILSSHPSIEAPLAGCFVNTVRRAFYSMSCQMEATKKCPSKANFVLPSSPPMKMNSPWQMICPDYRTSQASMMLTPMQSEFFNNCLPDMLCPKTSKPVLLEEFFNFFSSYCMRHLTIETCLLLQLGPFHFIRINSTWYKLIEWPRLSATTMYYYGFVVCRPASVACYKSCSSVHS